MELIDQYNIYLTIKKEINEIDTAFLLIILSNKKYKFCNKIYNLLIKEINKSKLDNTEKELMKKFIFLDV